MASMKCGGGPITAGTTYLQIAERCGCKELESITIYPTTTTVQITWGSGEVSQISENMKGHTFVAMNGSKLTTLDNFTIDTNCEIAFIALG